MYKAIDSFTNVVGNIITVFERMSPDGTVDLVAKVIGNDELTEVSSIAMAGLIMAEK